MIFPFWGTNDMPFLGDKWHALFGDKWNVLFGGQMICPFWGTNEMLFLRDKWYALFEGQMISFAAQNTMLVTVGYLLYFFMQTWLEYYCLVLVMYFGTRSWIQLLGIGLISRLEYCCLVLVIRVFLVLKTTVKFRSYFFGGS